MLLLLLVLRLHAPKMAHECNTYVEKMHVRILIHLHAVMAKQVDENVCEPHFDSVHGDQDVQSATRKKNVFANNKNVNVAEMLRVIFFFTFVVLRFSLDRHSAYFIHLFMLCLRFSPLQTLSSLLPRSFSQYHIEWTEITIKSRKRGGEKHK